ncbi:MAG: glycosyltransferase family 2 protein [Candidatus Hydrogenedentes bacterium]|nr:glycosyltransferase family 2 protein [Candidatus Hydrogenedentota bacterium]
MAVVLTWNDTEMTAACVRSLLASHYPLRAVVVVDNGSEPPCAPVLEEQFPGLETVQLSDNTGFTGGANRGIERALQLGADYAFFLNNDTIVHADAIPHLVEAMEQHPDAGFATALLLYPGPERRVQFYTGTIDRHTAQHRHPDDGQPAGSQHCDTVETAFAPACAILLRAETVRQAGLFDESLFTNWEDYDLCLRYADAGWNLLTVGAAEVIHAHGQTTGRISPFITYFFTRNRLICLFRYGRLPRILLKAPTILRTFYWQVRHHGFSNWPAHRAMFKGLFHFLLGIRGKGGAPRDRRDAPRA